MEVDGGGRNGGTSVFVEWMEKNKDKQAFFFLLLSN